MAEDNSNRLCLECGLCCNGVIFADVRLEPDDAPERLRSLGLRSVAAAGRRRSLSRIPGDCAQTSPVKGLKFPQPCAAFDGCQCRVYSDRPRYCREFECLLLKQVKAGRLETPKAMRMIRKAQECARKVKHLLNALGDTDESVALSLRFKRLKRRLESNLPDEETADLYGQLTLAVHDLNLLLSSAFYPNPGGVS